MLNKIAKGIGLFFCIVLAVFLSFFGAYIGAIIGGVREGGWNLQFLPFMIYGAMGGLLVALVMACALCKKQQPYSLVCLLVTAGTPLIVLVGCAVAAIIAQAPERREAREWQIAVKAEQDPAYVHQLLNSAIQGAVLSETEKKVIGLAASKTQNKFSDDEMTWLFNWFCKEWNQDWNVKQLLQRPETTSQHFQMAYDLYKEYNAGIIGNVFNWDMISNPKIPTAVLKDRLVEFEARNKKNPAYAGWVEKIQKLLAERQDHEL